MSEFWYTPQTMRALKGETHRSFEMFSLTHLFWFAVLAVGLIWVFAVYRKYTPEKKKKAYIILTALLLIDEVAKYIMTVATNQWLWQFLPLHLCSIQIFVCLWHTVRPCTLNKEILYALCIPGAVLALVSPSWMPLPLANFMHLHSATVHVMLLIYPFMILADGFKPNIKNLWKVLAFLFAVGIPVYGINMLLKTNFLFLMRTDNNPILNLVASIFGKFYLVGLAVLLSLVCFLVYLPWVFVKKK